MTKGWCVLFLLFEAKQEVLPCSAAAATNTAIFAAPYTCSTHPTTAATGREAVLASERLSCEFLPILGEITLKIGANAVTSPLG